MSKPFSVPFRPLLLAAAMPLLGLAAQPVSAASDCKGLTQDECAAKEQCRWQEGYARKDGIQVSSHCRLSKPKKDADTQAAAPKDKT